MSTTFTIDEKTGNAYVRIRLLPEEASTFHSDRISLDKVAEVAEADYIVREAFIRAYSTLMQTDEDDEEQEWDTLFALPHVQAGLCRLAEEVERQFLAGETEEGGFAVE